MVTSYLPPKIYADGFSKTRKILSTEESIEVWQRLFAKKAQSSSIEPDEESNSPVEQVKVEKINQPVSSGERKKN